MLIFLRSRFSFIFIFLRSSLAMLRGRWGKTAHFSAIFDFTLKYLTNRVPILMFLCFCALFWDLLCFDVFLCLFWLLFIFFLKKMAKNVFFQIYVPIKMEKNKKAKKAVLVCRKYRSKIVYTKNWKILMKIDGDL